MKYIKVPLMNQKDINIIKFTQKNVGYPSGTAMLMGMVICVCLNGTTAPMTSKTTLKYP